VDELVVKSVTGAAVPVPLSVAVCGVPLALSITLTDALKLAAEAGVNVTAIVQVDPAASVEAQVVVWAKSAVFVPMTLTPEMDRVAVPGFDNVNVCAALVLPTIVLGKDTVDGVNTACGAGPVAWVPVPCRMMLCGLFGALLETAIEPVCAPVAVGVNVTISVQPWPGE
jgi:hypothetical protein